VVNSVADVEQLPIGAADPTAYAVQTTYSVEEAAALVAALQARFSDLAGPASTDICYATTNRQQAVKALAAQADALIIAGESFSSNASRLAEVAAARCPAVQLVGNADQIDWGQVSGVATVGVAAAASTPESTVQDIVAAIGHRFRTRVSELEVVRETTVFKRVAIA
jgi:4-hydroxy-3-methylbut-2-enyl diphosphate reductase